MSDPIRLRNDPSSGIAGELLLSASLDEATEADKRRIAAALAAAAATGALSAGGGAAAGTGVGASLAKLSTPLFAKLAAFAVLVTATTSVVVRVAQKPPREPPTTQAAVTVASASATPVVTAAIVTSPAAPSVAASPSVATTVIAPPKASATSLAEEIALVDDARRALRAGNPRGALARLDRHRAAFPRGELVVEATVLRIDAMYADGSREAAKSLARSFLVAHPTSSHAPRLRKMFDAEP